MIRKQWLIVAIISFITICAWVVFDILHNTAKVGISPQVQDVIAPISPDFDIKGLE